MRKQSTMLASSVLPLTISRRTSTVGVTALNIVNDLVVAISPIRTAHLISQSRYRLPIVTPLPISLPMAASWTRRCWSQCFTVSAPSRTSSCKARPVPAKPGYPSDSPMPSSAISTTQRSGRSSSTPTCPTRILCAAGGPTVKADLFSLMARF